MSRPLLVDYFSCAGLGADGYAEAGWEVVCVDNDPRALRHNPHHTVEGDAIKLIQDKGFMAQFEAAHLSPPCQGDSATRKLADAQGKGLGRSAGRHLLPEAREAITAWGGPWVIENVNRSPVRHWPGAVRLCGSSFGLKVERHRWFAPSEGLHLEGLPCDHAGAFDVDRRTGKPRPWGVYYAKGDSIPSGGRTVRTLAGGHYCMGIHHRQVPWTYLCEGLPPAYTHHLGLQLLAHVGRHSEARHEASAS